MGVFQVGAEGEGEGVDAHTLRVCTNDLVQELELPRGQEQRLVSPSKAAVWDVESQLADGEDPFDRAGPRVQPRDVTQSLWSHRQPHRAAHSRFHRAGYRRRRSGVEDTEEDGAAAHGLGDLQDGAELREGFAAGEDERGVVIVGEIGEGADDLWVDCDRHSRVPEFGEAAPEDIGAVAVYDEAGVAMSRVSARRYLERLVESGLAVSSPTYGGVGRPELRYALRG